MEEPGKHKAAENLRGEIIIATACCELAPAKLLVLCLSVLRSTMRSAPPAVGVPVEVWLRLWMLQAQRLIRMKTWEDLRWHMQLGRFVNEKQLDLTQKPYFSEILVQVNHEEAQRLAGRYYKEVFFSDESLILVKAEVPHDLVDMCLMFYMSWSSVEDKVALLTNVPDPVIEAHDESSVVLHGCGGRRTSGTDSKGFGSSSEGIRREV